MTGTSLKSDDELLDESEKVAQSFTVYWSQSKFEELYTLFIPELQEMRSLNEFYIYLTVLRAYSPNYFFVYDKVVLENRSLAYAYLFLNNERMPPLLLEYRNNSWKFNAFIGFFESECAEVCPEENQFSRYICNNNTNYQCLKVNQGVKYIWDKDEI